MFWFGSSRALLDLIFEVELVDEECRFEFPSDPFMDPSTPYLRHVYKSHVDIRKQQERGADC